MRVSILDTLIFTKGVFMNKIKQVIDLLNSLKLSNGYNKLVLLEELSVLVREIKYEEMKKIIKNIDDYHILFRELLSSMYYQLIYKRLYSWVSKNYSYSKLKSEYGFKKKCKDFVICILPNYRNYCYDIEILYKNDIIIKIRKEALDMVFLLDNIEGIAKDLLEVLKDKESYFNNKEIHLINKEKLLKKFSNIKIVPHNMFFTLNDAIIDEKEFKFYTLIANEKFIKDKQHECVPHSGGCYAVFGEEYEIATIYFNVENMKDVNKALSLSRKINKILKKII